jgi:hypothetical protein
MSKLVTFWDDLELPGQSNKEEKLLQLLTWRRGILDLTGDETRPERVQNYEKTYKFPIHPLCNIMILFWSVIY